MHGVSLDLFEIAGTDYLVMVDRFSFYIWVAKLSRTSTSDVLKKLESWFLEVGYPYVIVSDNGPQFRSEFGEYCAEHNIHHLTSSPYNHQSNGLAESAVKQAKKLLKKSDSWRDFTGRLLTLRNTPMADGSASPAEKFWGRRQRHDLPYLHSMDTLRAPQNPMPSKLKPLQVGQRIVVQNMINGQWDEHGCIVAIRDSGLSYDVQRDSGGRTITRNRRFLKVETSSSPLPPAPAQVPSPTPQPRRSDRLKLRQ